MNISRMTPIQQNSFLYLMNNYNIAMIGFSKGKSISYLASIFSSIMNNTGDKTVSCSLCFYLLFCLLLFYCYLYTNNLHFKDNAHIGPKVVILSNSLGSCTNLENLSNLLISSAKKENKIKVVAIYETISVQSTIVSDIHKRLNDIPKYFLGYIFLKLLQAAICNGCDIVIATPSSLLNIFNKTKIISWSNLRYFVFDNIDILLDFYTHQVI